MPPDPTTAPALASATRRTHNEPMARRSILAGRTERLEFRLTDDERALVEEVSRAMGHDRPGTWARAILLSEARKAAKNLGFAKK